jgi:hypothetical protein
VALVALLQLGGDELGAGARTTSSWNRFLTRSSASFASPVSRRASRIEVRMVKSSRELHALLDGPRGVADFEAQVPEGVEHVLDHALDVGGLLVGPQEQQIDVGEGRQGAAAVAAHRHQRQALALGGVAGAEHVHGGEVP